MNFKLLVQDAYFLMFNEHFFSTLANSKLRFTKELVRINYSQSLYDVYPKLESVDRREYIFIHIPKCGGTSIANVLGEKHIRHIPASVFYSLNETKFERLSFFTVIRDPAERLVSMLMHYNNSNFSGEKEKAIFEDSGINEDNVSEYLVPLLQNRSFYNKFFFNTSAGRSGFPVSQKDYLVHKDKLLVKNIFTLEKMDTLENWLGNLNGDPVRIGHNNASGRKSKINIPNEIRQQLREIIPIDFAIYDFVKSKSGFVDENDNLAINELENILKKIKQK